MLELVMGTPEAAEDKLESELEKGRLIVVVGSSTLQVELGALNL